MSDQTTSGLSSEQEVKLFKKLTAWQKPTGMGLTLTRTMSERLLLLKRLKRYNLGAKKIKIRGLKRDRPHTYKAMSERLLLLRKVI